MSQTVWIITAIVVCLAAALIIMTLLNTTVGKAKDSTEQPIEQGGNIVKIEMCKRLCDSCIRSGSCGVWGTDIGEGCKDPGVNVGCSY